MHLLCYIKCCSDLLSVSAIYINLANLKKAVNAMMSNPIFLHKRTDSDDFLGWALAEWVERLTANVKSRNSPGFDPSTLRQSEIWGAADEAVLNKVHKNQKIPLLKWLFSYFLQGLAKDPLLWIGIWICKDRIQILTFLILLSWALKGAYLGKWGDDKRNILGLLFQYQDRRCLLKYKD